MLARLLAFLMVLCAAPAAAQGNAQNEGGPPNIILLFADDAGYADFGFHGSTSFLTPRLDQLAREGMLFEQAYVAHPTCGPSRAGLLTGKSPARFGYEHNNVPGFMDTNGQLTGDSMGLPFTEITMAQRLRDLGYHTGILGKWHQGNADRFHPLRRGFDEFYGLRDGARDYWPYGEDNPPRRVAKYMERGFRQFEEHQGYLTDALADEAAEFIARNKATPFFLYVSFTAPHAPMQSLPEDRARFPHLSGKRQHLAAMTLSLDRASGLILDVLEREGLSENTIVVFTNDNGGPSHGNASNNYPLAGQKSTYLEGGLRVPMLLRWPGRIAPDSRYAMPVSLMDLLPSFVAAGGGDPAILGDIDGVSLWPYLTGLDQRRPHEQLFWKRDVRAAMRDGDWKLIRYPDRPAALFNLAEDPSEQNDLASAHPDRLREMFSSLFAWEVGLQRPSWMLRRQYDAADQLREDQYRIPQRDEAVAQSQE